MKTKNDILKNQLSEIQEISISYKPAKLEFQKIKSSFDAVQILELFFQEEMNYCEHFFIAILNNQNQILGVKKISTGGMTGTVVDVRLIMQTALLAHGTAIILAHNHPSGTLRPSNADLSITKKIKKAGECMEIKVLDHLIFSREGYYSFADEGDL